MSLQQEPVCLTFRQNEEPVEVLQEMNLDRQLFRFKFEFLGPPRLASGQVRQLWSLLSNLMSVPPSSC